MEHYANGWMSGGHGITMILGWAVIIVALIAVSYKMGRAKRRSDDEN